MTVLVLLLLLALCVFAAGLFAGAETGLYSLSRTRLEAESRAGVRSARLIEFLVRDDARLLITLLVGLNIADLVATQLMDRLLEPFALRGSAQEIVIALCLTPVMLLFGELLPKDQFRRRPHTLVGWTAPILAGVSLLLLPLVLPLRLFTALLFRLFGIGEEELVRVQGREAVIDLLRERDEELSPELERMARKVLDLRAIPVESVMVPWRKVQVLRQDLSPESARDHCGRSPFSRLPVLDARGAVVGYVHQLEVLAAAPGTQLSEHLRPLPVLPPGLSIDRALARLRASGQRAAIVGALTRPLGLVTLKDLVEEISGELYRW